MDTNDDYSPEEAVRRFPSSQRFNNNDKDKKTDELENPPKFKITPEDIFAIMTHPHDDPDDPTLPHPAPNLPPGFAKLNDTSAYINETLARMLNPPEVWIFGKNEDAVVLPLLLSAIAICAIVGNILVLFAFFGHRRMRSGQNLMLVNVSIADLAFVVVTVPVAILNRTSGFGFHTDGGAPPPPAQLCRFVHYLMFVTVYVSVYTLVVTCVFRFFSEFLRVLKSTSSKSHETVLTSSFRDGTMFSSAVVPAAAGKSNGTSPLTVGNAALSCAVIWIAFMTSHLNFLIQKEGAIFEEPFICEHYDGGPTDTVKLRTLWVTFLTCAFLLPLIIVVTLSIMILRGQSRGQYDHTSAENFSLSNSARRLASDSFSEPRANRSGSYSATCRPGRSGSHTPRSLAGDDTHGRNFNQDTPHHTARLHRSVYEECSECCMHHCEFNQYLNGHEPLRNDITCSHFTTTNQPDNDDCHIIAGDIYEGGGSPKPVRHLPSETHDDSSDNNLSEVRRRRELTVVVMASTVTRCICWLPIQVFLLVDVFTPGPSGPFGASVRSASGRTVDVYRKAEMLAVCFAFASTFINPIVYHCACAEFRAVFTRIVSRCCFCFRLRRRRPLRPVVVVPPSELTGKVSTPRVGEMGETIMSIISDSSNRINYA